MATFSLHLLTAGRLEGNDNAEDRAATPQYLQVSLYMHYIIWQLSRLYSICRWISETVATKCTEPASFDPIVWIVNIYVAAMSL